MYIHTYIHTCISIHIHIVWQQDLDAGHNSPPTSVGGEGEWAKGEADKRKGGERVRGFRETCSAESVAEKTIYTIYYTIMIHNV